ncbi:hypothetical protein PGT21_018840 [Puccinia graminis f. sp. tritici]|uniref:Uncharacterized protein n=1 Tax=Puccinia graminis f. sp. tritici TaxID=56615 RepID=A0A5B0QR93_PUCGR|nr:hypothetical protein PGT21_018840 [Puccinia graminis f. sp. tritici]KAA1115720.1 hypothetical protein PGTUg99_028607 [Puccinia graminis f. sp. tritici]
MKASFGIQITALLAHLHVLAVKSGITPGELIGLGKQDFQHCGNQDLLGDPVWIDLNLSVGGCYKDPLPKMPKGISSGDYLLDHENKDGTQGSLTMGNEFQAGFKEASSPEIKAKNIENFCEKY